MRVQTTALTFTLLLAASCSRDTPRAAPDASSAMTPPSGGGLVAASALRRRDPPPPAWRPKLEHWSPDLPAPRPADPALATAHLARGPKGGCGAVEVDGEIVPLECWPDG